MAERFCVRVPATCANLGCLFDCAALALSLHLDLHVNPRNDRNVSLQYTGVTPERVAGDSNNLVARVMVETLESWGKKRGFDIEIHNQIPVAVGLGSSAAAIVGALVACHWLVGRPLFDEELVTLASLREGHPDNVAAAWHGGFTVAVSEGERVIAYSCPIPTDLQLVLVVPNYALATKEARAVLPNQYSRADAIHNLQRAAALAAHFFSGKTGFRAEFFEDRWHQPYRAPLVPGLAEVLSIRHPDVLGICLSGAGPSILAFVRANPTTLSELIRQTLAQHGIEAQPYLLTADNRGAKGWSLAE
ncbi:MAG TPA: homoserine kinase [Terriglobia bacterium]|nr:homoserine kinase [Terriglobia bacterium]